MAASRDVILEIQIFFSQASREHFPHNGWKILGRAVLAFSAKCETARLDQYIWQNLVAWFPTRRLFDAGHLKLVGLRQFVFLLHPRTDFRDQRARFSRIRAGVKLAAPSKTVNNVIRNSVQFSSLRSSRKVALGGTRTLHWMLHAIFNLSRISIKDAFVASYIAFKQLIARFWWIIWEK